MTRQRMGRLLSLCQSHRLVICPSRRIPIQIAIYRLQSRWTARRRRCLRMTTGRPRRSTRVLGRTNIINTWRIGGLTTSRCRTRIPRQNRRVAHRTMIPCSRHRLDRRIGIPCQNCRHLAQCIRMLCPTCSRHLVHYIRMPRPAPSRMPFRHPVQCIRMPCQPSSQPSASLHQDVTPDLQQSGLLHRNSESNSQPSGSFYQDATSRLAAIFHLHRDAMPGSASASFIRMPCPTRNGSLHQDSAPKSLSGSSHNDLAPPESPLHDTFFNDALKKKLKIYASFANCCVSVGLTIGVQELIKDTRSHGASTFLPSLSLPLLSTLTESQTF
jgi:hypothetical protein